MRLTRLHVDARLDAGGVIDLPPAPALHVARVLRARDGDAVVLFNGDGREFDGIIESVRAARVTVAVGEGRSTDRESPLALTLVQCIPRGDRMDWVVQKATELGVTRIVPLVSQRSVVKLAADQAGSKAAHWRAVAIGACEQCGRNRLPVVDAPRPLIDFLGISSTADLRLVLEPDAREDAPGAAAPRSIEFAIGPEGGLTPEELDLFRLAGFGHLRLGPRILRAETAAITATVWLQARFGDLGGSGSG